MKNIILITAASFGLIALSMGAFGSHLLFDLLNKYNRVDTFDTAVEYHFYHTFFLFIIGLYYGSNQKKYLIYSFWTCFVGVILFSGSLYGLCLTNFSFLGYITPFGGCLLIFSYILFFLAVLKT